ncbi:hypothetical protein LS72_005845 [Helicobacter apodemus]|uniref:Uncharacterized protein n=1 Tax=Helicobacter apodemus TaxID=135569 RepID=A0A4U8UEB7_9HELI|nr:hypothetical protein [Helicobacter apodemus]MDE6958003.1 hypothetical protein [Helicobacter apodemus]TLE15757.1 hypothetical protein LS72_005845 [Helicobacter apodemus]
MPLPFIAGLAIGSTAALLFTKRKTLKKILESKNIQKSFHQGKEISLKAYNKLSKSIKDAKGDLEQKFLNKETTTKKTSSARKNTKHKEG